jgi:hypothetical protein
MRIKTITLTLSTLLISSVSALAQDRNNSLPAGEQQKYLVSARAGIVNLVEGELNSKKGNTGWAALFEGNSNWNKLITGDEVGLNDSVRSTTGTRAEVLLTPGVYLRLAGDTEFVFMFDGDARQELELKRGSIVIEASVDSWILVSTPKSEVHLVRGGLYRINATPDSVEVVVRDGAAYFGDAEVKEGRRAVETSGQPLVSKFDKKSIDLFDQWSKDRAKSLIALNSQLSQRTLRNSGLISSINNVWLYDRRCGCYTFLPWSSGYASPYGWDYSVCNPFWSYRPPYYYNPGGGTVGGGGGGYSRPPNPPSGGGGNSGGGNHGGGGYGGGGNRGGGGNSGGGYGGGGGRGSGGAAPSAPAPSPSAHGASSPSSSPGRPNKN